MNQAAASGGDGTSWDKAFQDLQNSINQAPSGCQVLVAEGTYNPTSGTDRYATFHLASGVAIYGGLDGSETALAERNWQIKAERFKSEIAQLELSDL